MGFDGSQGLPTPLITEAPRFSYWQPFLLPLREELLRVVLIMAVGVLHSRMRLFLLWRHQPYVSAVVRAESPEAARALAVESALTPESKVEWADSCCEELCLDGPREVILTDDGDLESS